MVSNSHFRELIGQFWLFQRRLVPSFLLLFLLCQDKLYSIILFYYLFFKCDNHRLLCEANILKPDFFSILHVLKLFGFVIMDDRLMVFFSFVLIEGILYVLVQFVYIFQLLLLIIKQLLQLYDFFTVRIFFFMHFFLLNLGNQLQTIHFVTATDVVQLVLQRLFLVFDSFYVFLQLIDFDWEDTVAILVALNLLVFFLEEICDLCLTIF